MKNKFISACDFFKNKPSLLSLSDQWVEQTTTLIHAPRKVDKTTRALDMAIEAVKSGRKVLYIDTQRSLDSCNDKLADVSNLFVFRPAYDSTEDKTDYADLVISGIEEAIAETDIRTFVIDSVTRIAALSFGRNASASYVMKRLVALQVRCNLSLLIISHDTTKSVDKALDALADNVISLTEIQECHSADNQVPKDLCVKNVSAPHRHEPQRSQKNKERPIDPSFYNFDKGKFWD